MCFLCLPTDCAQKPHLYRARRSQSLERNTDGESGGLVKMQVSGSLSPSTSPMVGWGPGTCISVNPRKKLTLSGLLSILTHLLVALLFSSCGVQASQCSGLLAADLGSGAHTGSVVVAPGLRGSGAWGPLWTGAQACVSCAGGRVSQH